jgi:hypothetical protein
LERLKIATEGELAVFDEEANLAANLSGGSSAIFSHVADDLLKRSFTTLTTQVRQQFVSYHPITHGIASSEFQGIQIKGNQ